MTRINWKDTVAKLKMILGSETQQLPWHPYDCISRETEHAKICKERWKMSENTMQRGVILIAFVRIQDVGSGQARSSCHDVNCTGARFAVRT